MPLRNPRVALALAAALLSTACERTTPPAAPNAAAAAPQAPVRLKLTYGIALPLGATFASDRAQAARELLEGALGAEVEARVFGYRELEQGLAKGQVDVAFSSPLIYVRAAQQAKVSLVRMALHRDRAWYRSAFFVRGDSGVTTLDELKGREVAFVDEGSASGSLFPKAHLATLAIDPGSYFGALRHHPDHSGVCTDVLEGRVQAGASYTHGEGAVEELVVDGCRSSLGERTSELRVLFTSDPIPNDVLVVREGFSSEGARKLGERLDALSATEEGRRRIVEAFGAEAFGPAKDEAFARVRHLLAHAPTMAVK